MKIFHKSRPWVYIFDGTMIFKGFVQMQGKYKQGTNDLDRGQAEMVYLFYVQISFSTVQCKRVLIKLYTHELKDAQKS